jgi:hypothetical protein
MVPIPIHHTHRITSRILIQRPGIIFLPHWIGAGEAGEIIVVFHGLEKMLLSTIKKDINQTKLFEYNQRYYYYQIKKYMRLIYDILNNFRLRAPNMLQL